MESKNKIITNLKKCSNIAIIGQSQSGKTKLMLDCIINEWDVLNVFIFSDSARFDEQYKPFLTKQMKAIKKHNADNKDD